MASIARREDGQWRARYRDPDGKEHARHFPRRVDAQKWLDEVTAAVVTGQYVDPRAGKVTLRSYAESWRVAQVHRRKTADRIESTLRCHVYPALGDRPLAAIRRSEVQAFLKGISDQLAPSTVVNTFTVLRMVLKAATADRVIPSSPCVGIRPPKAGRKVLEPLPVETVRRIEAALPARYRAVATVTAGSGLRPGEVLGLAVRHVDFLRRTVQVEQQLDDEGGIVAPKTDASYRMVPVPQLVIDALAAHLATYPPGPCGLVFTSPTGGPVKRNSFNKVWRTAVLKARAPAGARHHDLRHFYASLLIRYGESVKVVQARLGHASAVETLNTYSHMWPDSEDRTRAAVEAVLAAPADSVRTSEASSQVKGAITAYLEKG